MVALVARLTILVPLAFTIVSVVLSALALFAGHKEGFMEDYAIARLNTSGIGQDLIDLGGDGGQQDSSNEDDSTLDRIADTFDDAKQDVEDTLNDTTGSIADQLADTLGISEWYSLHVTTGCEGMYKPNATARGAGLNVTGCTNSKPKNRINLEEILDQELSVGPLELSLADINWPPEIQDKLDIINNVLLGLFILYVLTMAFAGLSVLGSVASFVLPGSRFLITINLTLSLLAFLTSAIASIITTVAVTKGINELNDIGEEVGVIAQRGKKFLAITWIITGFMLGATAAWASECILASRRRKTYKAPRKSSY